MSIFYNQDCIFETKMKSCDFRLKECSSTRIVKGGAVRGVRYSNPGALPHDDDDDDDDDDDGTAGASSLAAAP